MTGNANIDGLLTLLQLHSLAGSAQPSMQGQVTNPPAIYQPLTREVAPVGIASIPKEAPPTTTPNMMAMMNNGVTTPTGTTTPSILNDNFFDAENTFDANRGKTPTAPKPKVGGFSMGTPNQIQGQEIQPQPQTIGSRLDTLDLPATLDVLRANGKHMETYPDTLHKKFIVETDSSNPVSKVDEPDFSFLAPELQPSLKTAAPQKPFRNVKVIGSVEDQVKDEPQKPASAGGSAMIQYDPKGAGLVPTDSLGNKEPQELYGGKGFLLKMQQDWNNMNGKLPDDSPIKRNARQDMEIQGDSVKNDPMVLPEINAIHNKYNADGKNPLLEQQKIAERIKDLHKHGTEPYRRGSIQGYKKDVGDMLQAYYFYTNRTLP